MTIWIGLIALGLGLGTSLFLPVPQTLKTNFDAGQSLYALGEYEGKREYTKMARKMASGLIGMKMVRKSIR